jgi:hypothetical protein
VWNTVISRRRGHIYLNKCFAKSQQEKPEVAKHLAKYLFLKQFQFPAKDDRPYNIELRSEQGQICTLESGQICVLARVLCKQNACQPAQSA